MKFVQTINDAVGGSFVGRFFKLNVSGAVSCIFSLYLAMLPRRSKLPISYPRSFITLLQLQLPLAMHSTPYRQERGTSFSTELAGASATFLTMAYILAVNPRILADSGGPCEADWVNDCDAADPPNCGEFKLVWVSSTLIALTRRTIVACRHLRAGIHGVPRSNQAAVRHRHGAGELRR